MNNEAGPRCSIKVELNKGLTIDHKPKIKIKDAAKSTYLSCSAKSFAWAAATEKIGNVAKPNKKEHR